MDENERNDVAKCISSLLASTQKIMNIKQLDQDFYDCMGRHIPFLQFGCHTLEEYLRTLTDRVQVIGHGINAQVQVLINDKTAHINQLVAQQRKPKPSHRRSMMPTMRQFNCYTSGNCNTGPSPVHRLSSNYSNTNTSYKRRLFPFQEQTAIHFSNKHENYNSRPNNDQNQPANDSSRLSANLEFIPATSSSRLHTNEYSNFNGNGIGRVESDRISRNHISGCSNASGNGATPKRITGDAANHFSVTPLPEVDEIFFSDNEENVKVPAMVQSNLKKLIIKYPDGIWCSNMLEMYRKEYGRTLNFNEYGHRSVAQMCVDLRNVFSAVQLDNGELKVFDKDKPIPKNTVDLLKSLELLKHRATHEKCTTETALPKAAEELMTAIYTEEVPPDTVPYGVVLKKQWIDATIGENEFIDVNVAEVYDPSKFWFNLKNYSKALNTLMDDMQIFYSQHREELEVPLLAFRPNLYVAAIFAKEYHRARVIDTARKQEKIIKVFFVDYGTVSLVYTTGICYLHNKFTELPEQAIRARLAGIFPPREDEQWSRQAASYFLEMVMQRDLVAQIDRIDSEQQILDLILADTTDPEEDFFINDALVAQGFALFTYQVNSDSLYESQKSICSSVSSNKTDSTSSNEYNISKLENLNLNGSVLDKKKTRLSPKEIMQILKSKKD